MLFIRRISAYLLDIIVLFVILAPLGQAILGLVGTIPRSGPAIAQTILWNFSVPAWLYFIFGDRSVAGATLGKRLCAVQVRTISDTRLSWRQAIIRTAVKLLPWEIVHVAAFALSADLTQFRPPQMIGVGVANLLIIVYLVIAMLTRGQRSVHDLLAGTLVQAASRQGAPREEIQ